MKSLKFAKTLSVPEFVLSSEKSNSYRAAALAFAFIQAGRGLGYEHRRHARSIAFKGAVAFDAYTRLVDMATRV
jgi:hypothetical protein